MSTVIEATFGRAPEFEVRPVRKIRVLRLFSRLNIGGPAIHVILATAGLDSRRYESHLVVGREGQREGNFFDLAHAKGVNFRVIPSFVRRINPVLDSITLVELYRLMKRDRPDIVHTHTAKAGALGRIAARMAKVPVVVHTFHGSVFQGYFDTLSSHLFQIVERTLGRWTDAVVSVSPRVADEIERRRVVPREKIEVIYLGLELDRYRAVHEHRGKLRHELSVSGKRPLIGCVGRLVPIKDLPTLFEAIARLRISVPNVILLVVGDGPERQKLELEVYRLGLGSNVRFLGFRRDLERIYADIDLAVNSSINEGTPVALIEAMSAGVPVVATNVGGTPDLLLNGLLGRLVSSGDSKGLSEAILHSLTRRDEALQLAREAKRQALDRFRSERLVSDLDALYQRLLDSKGVSQEEML